MSDYTARDMMNTVMGTYFAGDYAGVTHAGLCIVAESTGNVFLAQRAPDETDDPAVAETWEFPGGGMEPGETPIQAASREFTEETGLGLPQGRVVDGWRAPNGVYQGFVYAIPEQFDLTDWQPTAECQAIAWVSVDGAQQMPNLRPEMADFDWSLAEVSGNQGDDMTDQSETEPDLSLTDLVGEPLMIHGIMAPENTETGDGRAFKSGSITSRPNRLPFSYQKSAIQGHDGSVVAGSVDRMMRKDGMIHWEGQLMPTAEGDELCALICFFGQYGVSIDGDKGSIDDKQTASTGVLWFDAVRAAGLTAVAIPAFHEAYVALGPHPDMPPADSTLAASAVESGDMVTFKRGPGWATDPKATKRIHDYWMPGHPGGDKIAWGTPGDFARAKALIGEKIAKNSPTKVRFLNQIIAQWHHDALGYWPATHAKMERGGTKASGETLAFKEYTAEERKKAHTLPDGSFPIEDEEDLKNAIQSIGRAKDPAAAKRHIKSRAAALGKSDLVPDDWAVSGNLTFSIEPMHPDLVGEAYCFHEGCGEPGEFSVSSDDPMFNGIFCGEHAPEHEGKSLWADYEDAVEASPDLAAVTQDSEESSAWEAVLVSSAQTAERTYPSAAYFDRHPDTGALVIEEPDEFGFRRTYGYAGEWGVCHVGFEDRCVGLPEDEGDFPDFHLGRTRTQAGYINTGLITYKVDHRHGQRILTETAQQQHFDNVANAWAAVRLGMDERGIWFSGVVLPTVPEADLVLIEAAGQVSGEWKYGALRALQAVNVPGFPVMRSSVTYDESGEVELLVASAFDTRECTPTPKERMEALAQIDAEVRFAALKTQWEG